MTSVFQIAVKRPRVQIILIGFNITLKKLLCNTNLALCPIVPYYQYKTAIDKIIAELQGQMV